MNNIVTPLMRTTLNDWPENTPRYVSHPVIREYVQGTAAKVGANDVTIFGALVTKVWKEELTWSLAWTLLQEDATTGDLCETHHTSVNKAFHSAPLPILSEQSQRRLSVGW